jgi:hypothetical protein
MAATKHVGVYCMGVHGAGGHHAGFVQPDS